MMVTHLHLHSNFSLLEGLASPHELAQAAANLEIPALALTDHGRLTGAVEFTLSCRDLGIQPILGMELDVVFPPQPAAPPQAGSLVLLAQDLRGWSSLCRLASAAQSDPSGTLPVSIDLLARHNRGLICLTGGSRGPLDPLALQSDPRLLFQTLDRLRQIFPDRLYVQLQLQSAAYASQVDKLASIAREAGLPVVAAQSIYTLSPEQASLHRTLIAIRLNRPISYLGDDAAGPSASHLISPEELARQYAPYPQSLASIAEIASRCRFEPPLGVPQFPAVDLPPGITLQEMLRRKAEQGAARLYGADPSIQRRLDHELGVIHECGYEALFLVMQEIVEFAHDSGIPIASRGSASSSLVAHCLGITSPDPVRLNLYFERFLNPARATLPDIDTDLCSRRRDEVIQFVYRRFGEDRVAMVCTVNRFRRRSALRETAKAFGLSPAQVSELAESLPDRWYGPPDRFRSPEQPFAELAARLNDPLHQAIFSHASDLIGLPRHLSIHPGGVVIAPGPIADLVPTQLAAKGIVITQFDLDSIEKIGLVKIDLLGIRGLTVLGDVAQAIAESEQISKNEAPPNKAPPNDAPPNEAPPNEAPPNEVSPNDAPPNEVSPNEAPPNEVSPNDAPPNEVSPNDAPPNEVSPNDAPPNEAPPNDAPPNEAPPNEAQTADLRLPKNATHNQARRGTELLSAIPSDDLLVADLVEHGRTIGCFQIESPGMRATLKEIHARSVDDLMVALALYRPGPLTGGLKNAFVARFRGQQPTAYLHPALQPLLADTYGVILYQEQVLRIAYELAGFNLAEADLLRRAMSHFDPGKQMQALQESFIIRLGERSGVPAETGARIWALMAAFAGYGFPKAHAASYARVAWQSAWCKAHHPALFLAAVLANWGGYYGQGVYLTEARRSGLVIRPPDVNYAGSEFSVSYIRGEPVLFMGMNQVRELTHRTQARILKNRPFISLMDFLVRADPRPQEAENLARCGSLESFGSIPSILRQLESGGWRGGQLSLFDLSPSNDPEDWTLEAKAAAQEAVLGVSVIAHRLELYADAISQSGALSTIDAASHLGELVRVAGMRQTWRRSRTAAGTSYVYFMALEDLEGLLDVIISEDLYRRFRSVFSTAGPYILEGQMELDAERGEPFVRLERIWPVAGS